jgi:hypothetical protein
MVGRITEFLDIKKALVRRTHDQVVDEERLRLFERAYIQQNSSSKFCGAV